MDDFGREAWRQQDVERERRQQELARESARAVDGYWNDPVNGFWAVMRRQDEQAERRREDLGREEEARRARAAEDERTDLGWYTDDFTPAADLEDRRRWLEDFARADTNLADHLDARTGAEVDAAVEGPMRGGVLMQGDVFTTTPDDADTPGSRDSSISVLGNNPGYVWLSDAADTRRFQVPDEEYARMSDDERWAANSAYLDDAVTRGDRFVLSVRADEVHPASTLFREMLHLCDRGFRVGDDGFELLPPSARG